MVRARISFWIAATAAIVASPGFGGFGVAQAHPLHTSFAEIAHEPKTGSLMISLRVFVDDFTNASKAYQQRLISRHPRAAAQSPLVTYALASFTVADDGGRPIALESCGGKRVGDLMWLCFRARVAAEPKSLRVSSRILFDLYKDQINVVQTTLGRRKSNALFTPGDGVKLLR